MIARSVPNLRGRKSPNSKEKNGGVQNVEVETDEKVENVELMLVANTTAYLSAIVEAVAQPMAPRIPAQVVRDSCAIIGVFPVRIEIRYLLRAEPCWLRHRNGAPPS